MRMYAELAGWYPLITPLEDYAEEAGWYRGPMLEVLGPGRHRLLELGCGAGHNAHHLAADFDLTLVDPSPQMLALARVNCPDAALVQGDMRDLRLGRSFDAVFIHDAISYMLTRADLRAAMQTAWEHLRPGGVAVLVPDDLADDFEPGTDCGGSDGPDGRSLRYLEWAWLHPDRPERCVVDYTLVVREGMAPARVLAVDRHEQGLFPREAWLSMLAETGFVAEERLQPYEGRNISIFVARRPG